MSIIVLEIELADIKKLKKAERLQYFYANLAEMVQELYPLTKLTSKSVSVSPYLAKLLKSSEEEWESHAPIVSELLANSRIHVRVSLSPVLRKKKVTQ
jgi:hypothetical protein